MTAVAPSRTDVRTPAVPAVGRASRYAVLAAAAVVVLLRLPMLGAPMTPDEGGFLYVARHWGRAGGSLYGPYWVDRPPLLLALFRVGDLLGGLTGVRVLAAVGTALAVVALGRTADRLVGPRAAVWTAFTAALVLATPSLGAISANGELLAVPLVAVGLWLTAVAATATSTRRCLVASAAAGACAAGAVLVKQNFADVVVFALLLAWGYRRHDRVVGAPLAFVGGGLVAAGAALGTAFAATGTRPGAVLWAMYPFRLKAAGVMGRLPLTDRVHHLQILGSAWVSSAVPLLVVGAVVLLLLRRLPAHQPVVVATVGLAGFDLLSIAAGGSYWTHYLVQLAPATALAAGLLATSGAFGRRLVAAVLAVTAVGWAVALPHRVTTPGPSIGDSLKAVSRPGDSAVSLLGEADVVQTAGLASPYPYLWSLPSRTLDPQMTELAALLDGPQAPTWVVVRGSKTMAELEALGPGDALANRYHEVAVVCGRPIYLRDGVTRAVPPVQACRRPISPLF